MTDTEVIESNDRAMGGVPYYAGSWLVHGISPPGRTA